MPLSTTESSSNLSPIQEKLIAATFKNPKSLVETYTEPSQEEAITLRRIAGKISWDCYMICLVEFAERGSYYGIGQRLNNFIQQPLPPNSPNKTGAVAKGDSKSPSGALGKGLQTASALTLLLTFLAYVTPLIGGYLADKKWGRFKTLWIGVWVGFLSPIIFLIASIPKVMSHSAAIVPVVIGIFTLAWGSGFIKPNLLPLLLDQYTQTTDVIHILPSGERVIIDRDATLQRMTNIFYWAVNMGSFLGLATSYAARDVGFWLAFLIPMIIYMIMFPVLWVLDSRLAKNKPSGKSVLEEALKVLKVTFEPGWIKRLRNGNFWEYAKPSNLIAQGRTSWRKSGKGVFGFDDQFVNDVRVTIDACKIFLFYVIYIMNDNGFSALQTSQAASLNASGVPNDLMNSFNPIVIIIMVPIMDFGIYPLFRKMRIDFKPVYRIFVGFILASCSSLAGAIIQWRIYSISPCGKNASTCDNPTTMSLWLEVILFALAAASEVLAITAAYQISYTRSPEHMKGFVMALFLFTFAIAAAISEACTGAMKDPHLANIFLGIFVTGVVFALAFLWIFRNLHVVMEKERLQKEALANENEDKINSIIRPIVSRNESVVTVMSNSSIPIRA